MELRLPHMLHLFNIFRENDGKENCAQVLEEELHRMLGIKCRITGSANPRSSNTGAWTKISPTHIYLASRPRPVKRFKRTTSEARKSLPRLRPPCGVKPYFLLWCIGLRRARIWTSTVVPEPRRRTQEGQDARVLSDYGLRKPKKFEHRGVNEDLYHSRLPSVSPSSSE